MDYEKKIRDYMNSSEVDQLYKSMLNNLFPELVEPKEEKARRSLLEFLEDLFKLGKNINFDRWSKADCEEWVNWVMKQGEQKPTNWFQELEDKLANATPQQLAEWKEKYFKEEPAEWSEEDEENIDTISKALVRYISYDGITQGEERRLNRWLKSLKERYTWKPSGEHYELEEFAKIVRSNLTGISKAVQKLFEAKYLQLTGNKMYGGFKD